MASSMVKSAAHQLGNVLVEEAKYLHKVRDKIERFQTELKKMASFLRDADNQQHQEEVIRIWVSQVRDLAYDAEDIIERYLHEVTPHRQDGVRNTLKWFPCILWTCDAWALHNLGSKFDDLTFKMSELRNGIQIIRPTKSQEYNTMTEKEGRTYSHTEEDAVGLNKDVDEVVDQLLKTDVKVVAICGIDGLGKTTLVREVFKHKDIKYHFNDNCAWVYISKEVERSRIFREILLGLEKGDGDAEKKKKKEIKELTTEELVRRLQELLQKQKCLVVLDDIWTDKAWNSLKQAFGSIRGSPSKILLTTRSQGLLQQIDPCGYLHLLQPLSSEDSWKLLKRRALMGDRSITGGESSTPGQNKMSQNEHQDDAKVKHERDELEELGRKMLKHCNGLPLAILALGGILSAKKTTEVRKRQIKA